MPKMKSSRISRCCSAFCFLGIAVIAFFFINSTDGFSEIFIPFFGSIAMLILVVGVLGAIGLLLGVCKPRAPSWHDDRYPF
ncbi:MAG: hypothetical protein GF411_18675 [Candidatus Lokiarchaeota archaeon]|nr:hypothetical protein [Candidatus Lokiarchaeota archaeon]